MTAKIRSQLAIVYYGGGRRYLTKRAACRAEARKVVSARMHEIGVEWDDRGILDWYMPRVHRLARFYMRWFKDEMKGTEQ